MAILYENIWKYDNGHETLTIERYKDEYTIESMVYDGERILDMIQIDISEDELIDMVSKLNAHIKKLGKGE